MNFRVTSKPLDHTAQCTDLQVRLLVTSSEQSTVSCGLWSNLRCKLELAADWSGKANVALWLTCKVSASIRQMTAEATRGAWLYNIASLSVPINPRETHPSLTPSLLALSLATKELIPASDWSPLTVAPCVSMGCDSQGVQTTQTFTWTHQNLNNNEFWMGRNSQTAYCLSPAQTSVISSTN